jgi:hypothetical protein
MRIYPPPTAPNGHVMPAYAVYAMTIDSAAATVADLEVSVGLICSTCGRAANRERVDAGLHDQSSELHHAAIFFHRRGRQIIDTSPRRPPFPVPYPRCVSIRST